MKFTIKTILALILITNLGCDDNFESVNSNPNQPEDVPSEVLITNATRSSMTSMVNESFLLANNVAQTTAKTLRTEIDEYNWNAFSTLWLDQYEALTDFIDAEVIATENGQVANQGASIIMQSWIFYTLTMAYGDIPYSEAIAGLSDDNFTPAYDDQQAILDGNNGILSRLDEAINLLQQTNQDVEGDLIYNGDTNQWIKLANVLKLRTLLHLSNKRDVAADMQAIVNNGMLFDGNADNATLNYLNSFPNDYPLFPLKQGDFDAVVLSESLVNKFQDYNDPRLGEYGRPDNVTDLGVFHSPEAVYSGAENGSETGGCNKGGSRLGARFYDYPSHPTGDTRANGIITTYTEQELILAEAIQKGLLSGDAEMHYKGAIQASMEYYTVNAEVFGWTSFEDFYNNSGVAYDGTLEKIWEQKWIGLLFHGIEPFFDIRRMVYEANNNSGFAVNALSFLNIPCANQNDDIMPVRFLYPGDEQSLNAQNYQNAVDGLGGNNQNATPWLFE